MVDIKGIYYSIAHVQRTWFTLHWLFAVNVILDRLLCSRITRNYYRKPIHLSEEGQGLQLTPFFFFEKPRLQICLILNSAHVFYLMLVCSSRPFAAMATSVAEDHPVLKEQEHVHQVYSKIASHFSDTRYKPWPRIAEFLQSLPAGSLVTDVGETTAKQS